MGEEESEFKIKTSPDNVEIERGQRFFISPQLLALLGVFWRSKSLPMVYGIVGFEDRVPSPSSPWIMK